MIGAKLSLKAVSRMAKRCGHHARIGNDHVKRFPFRQQFISASTHTLKVGKIEPISSKLPSLSAASFRNLRSRVISFGQIPRRAHNVRAMCRQRPRRSTPSPAKHR